MRTRSIIAFATLAVTCACAHNKKHENEPVSAEEQAAQAREQTAHEVSSTEATLKKQRTDYQQKATDDLNKVEARIAAFKAKAPGSPDARAQHDQDVQSLEESLKDARDKVDALKTTSDQDWADAQREAEQSILAVRSATDATVGVAH